MLERTDYCNKQNHIKEKPRGSFPHSIKSILHIGTLIISFQRPSVAVSSLVFLRALSHLCDQPKTRKKNVYRCFRGTNSL